MGPMLTVLKRLPAAIQKVANDKPAQIRDVKEASLEKPRYTNEVQDEQVLREVMDDAKGG